MCSAKEENLSALVQIEWDYYCWQLQICFWATKSHSCVFSALNYQCLNLFLRCITASFFFSNNQFLCLISFSNDAFCVSLSKEKIIIILFSITLCPLHWINILWIYWIMICKRLCLPFIKLAKGYLYQIYIPLNVLTTAMCEKYTKKPTKPKSGCCACNCLVKTCACFHMREVMTEHEAVPAGKKREEFIVQRWDLCCPNGQSWKVEAVWGEEGDRNTQRTTHQINAGVIMWVLYVEYTSCCGKSKMQWPAR